MGTSWHFPSRALENPRKPKGTQFSRSPREPGGRGGGGRENCVSRGLPRPLPDPPGWGADAPTCRRSRTLPSFRDRFVWWRTAPGVLPVSYERRSAAGLRKEALSQGAGPCPQRRRASRLARAAAPAACGAQTCASALLLGHELPSTNRRLPEGVCRAHREIGSLPWTEFSRNWLTAFD